MQMVVFGKRIEGLLAFSVQHVVSFRKKKFVTSTGLEHASPGLPSRDSTTELQRHSDKEMEI